MFKIPEALRGLVKSFAQACLNLRHYRPDNILVHLSQRLLSPRVLCNSSLSQLGFPTSLAPFLSGNPKKNLPKVVCLWNMTHHLLQPGQWLLAFSAMRVMSFQQGFYCRVSGLLKRLLWQIFFCKLQPVSFKHSLNINLVNSQFVGFFCQADLIIVHCRIDNLLPLPFGEIHCRPSACKLFFCVPSVLPVLNNLVNHGFGHSQLLEGFDNGICAKREIN